MKLPDAAALLALPVHVLVRDYPESLAVLRRFGVDAASHGGQTVAAALSTEAAAFHEALQRAAGWRQQARPAACDREASAMTERRAAVVVNAGPKAR